MLFLTASFQSGAHKHSDCLSLVWQEGGRNILIDRENTVFKGTRCANTS